MVHLPRFLSITASHNGTSIGLPGRKGPISALKKRDKQPSTGVTQAMNHLNKLKEFDLKLGNDGNKAFFS
jgi:hypothetical protein